MARGEGRKQAVLRWLAAEVRKRRKQVDLLVDAKEKEKVNLSNDDEIALLRDVVAGLQHELFAKGDDEVAKCTSDGFTWNVKAVPFKLEAVEEEGKEEEEAPEDDEEEEEANDEEPDPPMDLLANSPSVDYSVRHAWDATLLLHALALFDEQSLRSHPDWCDFVEW